MITHMAVDQYGETFHDLGPHPRKELLARLDRKRAAKMYVDGKDGVPRHIGWVIGIHWLTVFKVERIDALATDCRRGRFLHE